MDRKNKTKVQYDTHIYESEDPREDSGAYVQEIDADDDHDDDFDPFSKSKAKSAQDLIAATIQSESNHNDKEMMNEYREQYGSGLVNSKISDRESAYHRRRADRKLSPSRSDAFASEDAPKRSYKDIRNEHALQKEEIMLKNAIADKEATGDSDGMDINDDSSNAYVNTTQSMGMKKRNRWDDDGSSKTTSAWDTIAESHMSNKKDDNGNDQTPVMTNNFDRADESNNDAWGETPIASNWDMATPMGINIDDATPIGSISSKKSRWDETPMTSIDDDAQSVTSSTSSIYSDTSHKKSQQQMRWEAELNERNRPYSDEDLDEILPSTGYRIMEVPADYEPLRTPNKKLLETPTPLSFTPGFSIQETPISLDAYGISDTGASDGSMPHIKPEDYQYFGKLMKKDNLDESSEEEIKERKIMELLLKVKNGTPPQRKIALRQIANKARDFGAQALFNQILPLLMSPSLEDQERHLLVKVVDRTLYQLGDLVRPFVHKILVAIEPLLIDEDYYARIEGREIISNLAKAAGLATMISTMREDIDNPDEYVRNTTARAFAVVAGALGIPALLPFLKAVCQSKKSWEARHTGIKIIQQIAILMGAAVLPHLKMMVSISQHGLTDEQQKVRTITAQSLASLAEAAYPYGIEAFDDVLRPLWVGVRQHRSKTLIAFLKAIGFIIPLMEDEHADYYTKQVMVILIREFATQDEEMKKVVLKVTQQCISTDGVTAAYVRDSVVPDYFKNFWIRRMALDRRNHKHVVESTVQIANKIGCSDVINRIADDLKDESEPYRAMVLETIDSILTNLGAADITVQLEARLVDGVLYAFQEQTGEDTKTVLNGFSTIVNALGARMKSYLPDICGTIKWRLNNKSPTVRMQAADLVSRIAPVLKICEEDQLMGHLGVVLYEYLGEEYPEVLGSILGALKSIVSVIGMVTMTPPISDLLPRLTPILKNRHEKVQENCIELVGRIADRGAEYVSAKEWMRICFELLDLLKAKKKAIRRATVNTFGYIARAIGPQDVLHTLLSNLKVQERQMRVCTTIAIAIVADTCAPFTVLPTLMNEYRIPDTNIQNGVLKTLSFLFEYIGEMSRDYVYAVASLFEDALIDRDAVHRQTAATAIKHVALGAYGLGCEDVLVHLLNYIWPNIFEESPHVINATIEALEGLMVALGPGRLFLYIVQGLYHPARRVRERYAKIYNLLYNYSQHALIPHFPNVTSGESSFGARHQLECFI